MGAKQDRRAASAAFTTPAASRAVTGMEDARPLNGVRHVKAREVARMLVPLVALGISLGIFYVMPNVYPKNYEPATYGIFLCACTALYAVAFLLSLHFWKLRERLAYYCWLFAVLVILIELFDLLTLKTGTMKLPFVPSPDRIMLTFTLQLGNMMEALGSSMALLCVGVVIGIVAGIISATLFGWSHFCNYWIMGLMRVIGPIPAAVWIPIAMTLMPSSYTAGLFIITLALWFPITLMFGSAIRNVEKRSVEAARCLGAKNLQLLFRVAWPAAMPALFDGLFMGIAASFGALAVVEMIGAQNGLGFIVNWSRTWAQFDQTFCAVIIMIALFSLITAIFFQVRKRVLRWRVGLTQGDMG